MLEIFRSLTCRSMSLVEAFKGSFQQNRLGRRTRGSCMEIDQELHKNQSEV